MHLSVLSRQLARAARLGFITTSEPAAKPDAAAEGVRTRWSLRRVGRRCCFAEASTKEAERGLE